VRAGVRRQVPVLADGARDPQVRLGSLDEVSEQVSVYQAVGGASFFDDLVTRFYGRVASDPLLRPLYPEDLTDPIRHTSLFLQQYWGGPGTYSEERGHPRLRQRHLPFVIGEAERDAWFGHMAAALGSVVAERGTDPAIEERMLDYFAHAADFMVNAR
jgi:hemoglobin